MLNESVMEPPSGNASVDGLFYPRLWGAKFHIPTLQLASIRGAAGKLCWTCLSRRFASVFDSKTVGWTQVRAPLGNCAYAKSIHAQGSQFDIEGEQCRVSLADRAYEAEIGTLDREGLFAP
jgi:hypothetical protein